MPFLLAGYAAKLAVIDTAISSGNKLKNTAAIYPVLFDRAWIGSPFEAIERQVKLDLAVIIANQILKQKEIHIPTEVFEQVKERSVA
jgi:hypothetical protein